MLIATNPTTGQIIRSVAIDQPDEIERKLQAAVEGYRVWRTNSFEQRAAVLRAVAALLRERKEALATLMAEEMGKAITEGRGECEKAAWCAEHYAEHAAAYLSEDVLASDAAHSGVRYLPLGPVLGILPWNMPIWLALRFCAPALMAGNTCVIKHDPHTPGCAQALAEVFTDAGSPNGVLQMLYLDTPRVENVIRDARIQAVSFTGSSRGGAAVATIAANEIKPSVLELGGSDPCLVFADADLERAADVITLSRTFNAGQSCIAAKRVLIEAAIYDQFVAMLKQRLQQLTVGNPLDDTTDVGPLARADLRDQLHRQVEATLAAGATCQLGGTRPQGDGFFYPVTLLTDVKPGMAGFCQETFGPVLFACRVADSDEALAVANDTEYGLGASIWSTDLGRASQLAANIEAGQVVINGLVKTDPRLPSGGMKRSGYGRELGPHGIKEFTNAQQIWIGPSS